jgi:hypothetical protein
MKPDFSRQDPENKNPRQKKNSGYLFHRLPNTSKVIRCQKGQLT